MSFNSQEMKALAAPFWGVSMDDLAGVVVIGFTKGNAVLFVDSSQGLQEPGGPGTPAASATRDQAAAVAMHLMYAAHKILEGCVIGHE